MISRPDQPDKFICIACDRPFARDTKTQKTCSEFCSRKRKLARGLVIAKRRRALERMRRTA